MPVARAGLVVTEPSGDILQRLALEPDFAMLKDDFPRSDVLDIQRHPSRHDPVTEANERLGEGR